MAIIPSNSCCYFYFVLQSTVIFFMSTSLLVSPLWVRKWIPVVCFLVWVSWYFGSLQFVASQYESLRTLGNISRVNENLIRFLWCTPFWYVCWALSLKAHQTSIKNEIRNNRNFLQWKLIIFFGNRRINIKTHMFLFSLF